MAYVEPEETALDVVISSSKFDKCVAAIKELWKGVAAGDMEYYTGPTGKARLPIGTPGQKYAVNAGGTAPELVNGGITLIEEFVAAGGEADHTFSNIPQTYSHLKMIMMGRGLKAAIASAVYGQFNADTGAHYGLNYVLINNNVFTQGYAGNNSNFRIGDIPAASATANYAGVAEILIPNYKNTTFYKTVQMLSSEIRTEDIGGCLTQLYHSIWLSINAITAIKVMLTDATHTFAAGSIASLYGMG